VVIVLGILLVIGCRPHSDREPVRELRQRSERLPVEQPLSEDNRPHAAAAEDEPPLVVVEDRPAVLKYKPAQPPPERQLAEQPTRGIRAELSGEGSVHGLAFSPDNRTLAAACDEHVVLLFDIQTDRLLSTLTGHADRVRGVTFSPDSKLLASRGHDDTVRVWNVQTGQQMWAHEPHSWGAAAIVFSPNGELLTSAGNTVSGAEVAVFRARTGDLLRKTSLGWIGRPEIASRFAGIVYFFVLVLVLLHRTRGSHQESSTSTRRRHEYEKGKHSCPARRRLPGEVPDDA
jgi:hypothetical protein